MKVISVINQKGGVGKTTTSVNVAAFLARMGHSVLLIDLDPQAHATVGVGVDPDACAGRTIGEVLLSEQLGLGSILVDTYLPALKLAPASITLSKADSLLHARHFREQRLLDSLQAVEGFEFIVIDCQPTLGVLPVNAMVAADHFLIPTQPSAYAIRGLGDLLETLNSIKRGPRAWDYRILLTMVMTQASVANEAVDRILEPLRPRVLQTRIARCEALNRGQLQDQPRDVGSFAPSSRAARDYQQLTEELCRLWP